MSDLVREEPDDEQLRPGALSRIRPAARVAFGLIVFSTIASFAYASWEILNDIWNHLAAK
jgi:hypothetical protein